MDKGRTALDPTLRDLALKRKINLWGGGIISIVHSAITCIKVLLCQTMICDMIKQHPRHPTHSPSSCHIYEITHLRA